MQTYSESNTKVFARYSTQIFLVLKQSGVCVYVRERECGALLLDARHTGEEQSDLVCIEQCVFADVFRVYRLP